VLDAASFAPIRERNKLNLGQLVQRMLATRPRVEPRPPRQSAGRSTSPVRGVPVESSLVVPETFALRGLTIATLGMQRVPPRGPARRTAPDLAGALGGPTAVVSRNAIDFQVCP
jgi:hypothetical protein